MVEHLRSVTPRAEIILEEVPAPQKLATFAFAFTADVSNGLLGDDEDEIARVPAGCKGMKVDPHPSWTRLQNRS